MSGSYRVRGGIEDVSDGSSTGASIKQAAKEVKDLGTVDTSFSRGQLYLLDDEVVFAQSITESRIKNYLDNIFSKGPLNPLRTLGIYNPYEAPLNKADQYDGSWRLPYSEIEAVSLLSIGMGYEIFLRRSGAPGRLYRIRNEQGTDYIGFRWLHSPNHDTAVQMAGELFDQAMRYGGVEEFDAGGNLVSRTKTVEFPKGDSQYADRERVEQPTSTASETSQVTSSTQEVTPTAETARTLTDTESVTESDLSIPDSQQSEAGTVDDSDTDDSEKIGSEKVGSIDTKSQPVNQPPPGKKPMWSVAIPMLLALAAPGIFALSPFLGTSAEFGTTIYGAVFYTIISQWGGVVVAYGLLINGLSLPFYVISPYAILVVNSLIYVTLIIDVSHVRRRTNWKPRLRYYLPGTLIAWFITIPVYLYRRYKISKQYPSS